MRIIQILIIAFVLSHSATAQEEPLIEPNPILDAFLKISSASVVDRDSASLILRTAGFIQVGRHGGTVFWQHPGIGPLDSIDVPFEPTDYTIPTIMVVMERNIMGVACENNSLDPTNRTVSIPWITFPTTYIAHIIYLLKHRAGFDFNLTPMSISSDYGLYMFNGDVQPLITLRGTKVTDDRKTTATVEIFPKIICISFWERPMRDPPPTTPAPQN